MFKTISFCTTFLMLLLPFNDSGLRAEDDVSLEDILVETWDANVDSIRTFRAKLTIYRYRFPKSVKNFDIKKLIREIERSSKSGTIDDFLLSTFKSFYPKLDDPGTRGMLSLIHI